jgi:hypothetical protein
MNLREVQLSSRCVIPVALALPINREPGERATEAREREHRDGGERPSINRPLEFNL